MEISKQTSTWLNLNDQQLMHSDHEDTRDTVMMISNSSVMTVHDLVTEEQFSDQEAPLNDGEACGSAVLQ